MPANTKKVDRTTKWGNPWIADEIGTVVAVQYYIDWILHPDRAELRAKAREELRGKNLACWCALPRKEPCADGTPPNDVCHGKALLLVANTENDEQLYNEIFLSELHCISPLVSAWNKLNASRCSGEAIKLNHMEATSVLYRLTKMRLIEGAILIGDFRQAKAYLLPRKPN
jgi:hypothetical protein